MSPFAKPDHPNLFADSEEFDEGRLLDVHGAWGQQRLRNALALEVLSQISTRADEPFLFKGGTLLQSRLRWPPRRASIDVDLETHDSSAITRAIQQFVDDFSASGLQLTQGKSPLQGNTLGVFFPLAQGGVGYSLRIDVLEYSNWPQGLAEWKLPAPWKSGPIVLGPDENTQAAQKLLMCSEYPYGRNLGVDHGRKSRIKDLFDLLCLAPIDLDSNAITAAAHEDIVRKRDYLSGTFKLEAVIADAQLQLRLLVANRAAGTGLVRSLWRAYSQVRSTIEGKFSELDLRRVAGCAHDALSGILAEDLNWQDSWRPQVQLEPRKAWMDNGALSTHPEIAKNLDGLVGLREAWALHSGPRIE